MKRYENIEEKLCEELDKMDKKFASGSDITMQDLEMIRLIYSSLKSGEMFYGMKEESEMDEESMEGSGEGRSSRSGRGSYGRGGSGRSYARGRDSMGRFTSREMGGYSGEGYSGEYGYSGHYPGMMPPMYPRY